MKRALAAESWECRLFYVVLKDGEYLPPNVAAVKQHHTCGCIGVPRGTLLIDALFKLRKTVGLESHALALDEEQSCWLWLDPGTLSYSCAAGDAFYFKFGRSSDVTADVIDNSRAWACEVLKPFGFSVLELEGLRRALSEPLPRPFPVGDATYRDLISESSAAPDFVPSSAYPAERIASWVTSFIRLKFKAGGSENMSQSVWDVAFSNFWSDLLELAEITIVDFDRNVTDPSGASLASSRPDLMLWIMNRLCAKFEEKKLKLQDAFADLENKLTNLQPQYYGPVKWIIGVALAGDEMAAWAMRQGQLPDSLGMRLRMSSVKDKAACLRFSVNLLRVALSLAGTYGELVYLPRPYQSLPPLQYGKEEQITRRFRIIHSKAVKEIVPWSQHVAEGFTQIEFVKRAYALQAPGLMSGSVELRGDRYKVSMDKVGFQPFVGSEADLVVCLKDVLSGLKALHAAGLVHRDVRWKNVLRIPGAGFVLIDLETVWSCGDEPLCKLRDWDEWTLVNGKFTTSSDLQLVGKLMSRVENLSPRAASLQRKLLQHQLTVDQALDELDAISVETL